MHEYLVQHPGIHMVEKELHYWGSDLKFQNPRVSQGDYEKHFRNIPADQHVGEAAVWYLLSDNAATELKAHTPDAKIVIMLRNPVKAVESLHSQMVYTGNESLESLEAALQQEANRMTGEALPSHYYCPQRGICYTTVYQYREQIARYVEAFGSTNIHYVFFEDLKADTASEYKKLLQFMGIDSDFTPSFEVVNANKSTRNKKVQDFILKPGKSVKGIVKAVIPSKKLREKIKGKVWAANSKETERIGISDALKAKLSETMKVQIEFLAGLKNKQEREKN
jgi:hypothetical protein